MKVAPEGYPFIVGSLLVAVVAFFFSVWLTGKHHGPLTTWAGLGVFGISCAVGIFMVFFFRDPERVSPVGEGLYVAPADGKVIRTRDVYEDEFLASEAREISIFMSPLDVHVNRSPCDGRVVAVRHRPGVFFAAYREDASERNENIVLVIEQAKGKVLVRQVAGFLARRAVCRVGEGDLLRRGQRYGMIKFGSRLDVLVPRSARVTVNVGDRTRAGETVIAVDDESGQR